MKILRSLLLFSLVTGVIWIAVIWCWQLGHRDMTMNDILVDLVLLPVAAIALLLALLRAWRSAGRRATARAASAATVASGNPSPADASTPVPPRLPIRLLTAQVRSASGRSGLDMLDAARDGQPRPRLDPGLQTEHGLPVMCARIDDVDSDPLAEAMRGLLASVREREPAFSGAALASHVLRALAVLQEPLRQAIDDLQPWASRFAAPGPAVDPGSAVVDTAGPAPRVHVLAAWPDTWSAFEQAAALAWLRLVVTESATPHIPAARFTFDAQPGGGEALWMRGDRQLQSASHHAREDLLLLCTCDSGIGEEAIAAVERRRLLFSAADRPRGRIPGEGAAVLVLAPATWPDAPGTEPDPLRLLPASAARRDRSIEADGRVSADCLQAIFAEALQAGHLAASDVRALVCDADQHSARPAELFAVTTGQLAHLDPTEDMRLIGTGTGHTGVAGPLLVIAAAAEHARSTNQTTVALSLGDAFMRLALVVQPKGPTSS